MMQKQSARPIHHLKSIFFLLLCIWSWSCDGENPTDPVDPTRTVVQVSREQPELSTFYAVLERLNLLGTLQNQNLNFTLFAPSNQAFTTYLQASGFGSLDQIPASELEELIRYHIALGSRISSRLDSSHFSTLSGKKIFAYTADNTTLLNGSHTFSKQNLMANNGVVHVLESVLSPPAQSLVSLIESRATAQQSAEFTLLLAALQHSNLIASLENTEQRFTLFAPTDAAFRAAGYNTAEEIQAADPEMLRNILLYHLLSEFRFANMLRSGDVRTLQGSSVNIDASAGSIKGSANEQAAQLIPTELNQYTTNGVLHGIDAILLPD